MSALAQVLLTRGVRVSGSDPHANAATERLQKLGATVYREQVADNIEREKPDLVVVTAAVHEDNPELMAARDAGVEVVSRAEFLGRLMGEFGGARIAIAGTHGKTTTTAMVAEVLISGGLDPSVLVGGEYSGFGGNLRLGHGNLIVAEACEAYDSFLALHPSIAVITNVEADHLDFYGDEAGVFDSFRRFVGQTDGDGVLIWCSDDEGTRKLTESLGEGEGPARKIPYGLQRHGNNCVWAEAHGDRLTVHRVLDDRDETVIENMQLSVPGDHNARNALAAIAVGLELGLSPDTLSNGSLREFIGVGRRFEVLGERDGVTVIDDYAHHPTEIRATLAAARSKYPERRIVAVFQPHLYSRTRDFMDEFAASLSAADAILLTDIYAAREEPIAGVSVSGLTHKIAGMAPSATLLYLPRKSDMVGALAWVTHPGDVVITMGAGDIREVGEAFLAETEPAQRAS
jgi:UDP-N-acetylmuramate--alanine ligase